MAVDALLHARDEPVFDAIVIGGGFYGCVIACYLARQRALPKVLVIERESALMTRASYNNQARVHNGYHYPRSFTTAYRSRINFPRFIRDWPDAVKTDFIKLYAIARRNSKVNSRQFQRFCRDIGASLEPVDRSLRQLFDTRLIEDVFLAKEYVFDATALTKWAARELDALGIPVAYATTVSRITAAPPQGLRVFVDGPALVGRPLASRYVFNCTYSGLNQFAGDFPGTTIPLKQEITEMALLRMPSALERLGVTVMDGPFFSMMPFPARGLHTLSHVRYTPHLHWQDQRGQNPYRRLSDYDHQSRVDRMVRDVARFFPGIRDATYVDSLFEVKTVLTKNENDDGRPILFERHAQLPGCYSILGGKIDNIYDVLEKLDAESLH